jgi:hypothetical protein
MKPFVLGIALAGTLAGASYAQTTTTSPNTPATTSPNATSPQPAPTEGMPRSGAAGTGSTTATTRTDDKAAASGNTNQAVATTNANASEPAKGANSFTMGEAKSRLEKNGFADVSDLKKDDNGVWRGTGRKDGTASNVWLDYKGNTGTSSN